MRKSLFAATCFLLLPSLAAAGPDLIPGDSFTYESKTKLYTQVYEGRGPDGGHVFRLDGRDRLVFSASLSLVSRPGSRITPHNAQLGLDPELGFEVGKSWVISYEIERDDGSRAAKTRTCGVVAHEPELIVRAGTFDAYRVDCVIEAEGGRTRYGESWYDSRSWRALQHRVGDRENDLDKVLELVEIDLQPR